MVVLREFLRQSPPTFQGSSNPLDADRWICRVNKVIDDIGVVEDLKVVLAIYLFDGEVDHWWELVKRIGGAPMHLLGGSSTKSSRTSTFWNQPEIE